MRKNDNLIEFQHFYNVAQSAVKWGGIGLKMKSNYVTQSG